MRSRPLARQSPSTRSAPALRTRALPARAVLDEITLWTTRDGREIPLDEMSDEHIRNAIRSLSRWRARLKKQPEANAALKGPLTDAIQRFRRLLRKREKAATCERH